MHQVEFDPEEDRSLALSDDAAQTRQRLLSVLQKLPLVSLSKRAEATWAECFGAMHEQCNTNSSLLPLITDLDELQEQLSALGLSTPKGSDREWASDSRDALSFNSIVDVVSDGTSRIRTVCGSTWSASVSPHSRFEPTTPAKNTDPPPPPPAS